MLKLGGDRAHKSLSDPLYITADGFVSKKWKLLFSFLCGLSAYFNVVLWTVFVVVILDLCLRHQRQRHRHKGKKRQPGNKFSTGVYLRARHRYLRKSWIIPRALMILFDSLFPKFEHSFSVSGCTKTQQPYITQNNLLCHQP